MSNLALALTGAVVVKVGSLGRLLAILRGRRPAVPAVVEATGRGGANSRAGSTDAT